jgi:hypothetical protein
MTDKYEKIVAEIAEGLKGFVTDTETSIATTQNHYGEYMGLLMRFTDDASQRAILASALIIAGANEQGVRDALKAVT